MKLISELGPWGTQDTTYCRFSAIERTNFEMTHSVIKANNILDGNHNLFNALVRIITLLQTHKIS